MGLFDFIRPKKKNPMAEILQEPRVRSAMVGMQLEQLQKHVANLRFVGREEDANKAVIDFVTQYAVKGNVQPISRLDLARISYSLAYRTLPELVYARWDEFLDLWNGGVPFPVFLAIKGSSDMVKHLSLEQIWEFKYYQGELTSDSQYLLIEYPLPPEHGEGPKMDDLLAAFAKGQKPSLDVVPVLGPYFSAVIYCSKTNEKHIYILGQSLSGGTTIRFIAPGGMNANCGPGPDPSAAAFLEAVKSNLNRK